VNVDLDITQSLKDTENALRDFIAAVLEKANGTGIRIVAFRSTASTNGGSATMMK